MIKDVRRYLDCDSHYACLATITAASTRDFRDIEIIQIIIGICNDFDVCV